MCASVRAFIVPFSLPQVDDVRRTVCNFNMYLNVKSSWGIVVANLFSVVEFTRGN